MGVFNFPAAFYLAFLNNHSIHHRGELATYLRPMGSKVPAIYGGSYDEPFTSRRHRKTIQRCLKLAAPNSLTSWSRPAGGFFVVCAQSALH